MQAELEMAALREQFDQAVYTLKWYHAIISILVEEEGGVVALDTETVEKYDLNGQIQITRDEARDQYLVTASPAIIEGDFDESVV
jgi:hypothetical protein